MAQRFVKFPLAGSEGRMATVSVNDLGTSKGDQLLVEGGPHVFRLKKDHEVEEIVRAARTCETDLTRRGRKVSVDLLDYGDATVHGESYGLALAIADYLARYADLAIGTDGGGSGPQIVATGTLADAGGGIGPIAHLDKKLACIETLFARGELNPGDLFFFPKANEAELCEHDRAVLRRLIERGLACIAVEQLNFVKPLLTPEPKKAAGGARQAGADSRKLTWLGWALAGVISALAVAAILWYPPDHELTLTLNGMGPPDADLVVEFRHGGPDGQGRPFWSGTRPTLVSGERFTVHVEANRDAYFYIVHFDAAGAVRMLLAEDREGGRAPDGDRNLLRAGDRLHLPGDGKHYRLDDTIGRESFHLVASLNPVPGLRDAYVKALEPRSASADAVAAIEDRMRGIAVFSHVDKTTGSATTSEMDCTDATRGVTVGINPCPAGPGPGNPALGLRCLAPDGACRGIFELDHRSAD